jgi:hypothetical protein
MFTKLIKLVYRGLDFIQSRLVFQELRRGPETTEAAPTMADYRQRFREIENSLKYVVEGLPPEDLPDEGAPVDEDVMDRERTQQAAKRALKRLKVHAPDKVNEDTIQMSLDSLDRLYDIYLQEAAGPTGEGIPIKDVAAVDYDPYEAIDDEEDLLDEGLETKVGHAVGRVMDSWRGVKAFVGGKEVELKRLKIDSVSQLEDEVAKELAKASAPELRNAQEGSSWMIHDHGFSFLVSKEAGGFDVSVYNIDPNQAEGREQREEYASMARELEDIAA